MSPRTPIFAVLAVLALAACNKQQSVAEAPPPPAAPAVVAAPPPPPAGSIPGSMAADRDGDGMVDGYYTSDGIYHPSYTPPPARSLARSGERG